MHLWIPMWSGCPVLWSIGRALSQFVSESLKNHWWCPFSSCVRTGKENQASGQSSQHTHSTRRAWPGWTTAQDNAHTTPQRNTRREGLTQCNKEDKNREGGGEGREEREGVNGATSDRDRWEWWRQRKRQKENGGEGRTFINVCKVRVPNVI